MWFKSLFGNRRYKEIAKVAQEIPPTKPARALCEDLLNALTPERFVKYEPAIGLGVVLTPGFSNIDTYTRKLKEANLLIKLKRPIPPNWYSGQDQRMSLDRFLVSEDGHYLRASEAIALFKKTGLELCALMEPSDTEPYGLYEHNLRMLTKLLINLRSVADCLVATQ